MEAKHMKRAAVMMCAGIFAVQACGVVFAMDGKAQEGSGTHGNQSMGIAIGDLQEKRVEGMAKELKLTPEQKAKIAAILKDNGEKVKVELQKIRDTTKAMWLEADKQIIGVLNAEQAKKFEKMKADSKEKMEKMMQRQRNRSKQMK